MKTHAPHSFAAPALALALLAASALKADFAFHVDLDTGSLAGSVNAPFYLDFQLNQGSSTLPNSIILSNFTFDHGSTLGSSELLGDTSGSLNGSINLDDNASSPFNEFFQGFSASTTGIHFDAMVSQNAAGATPDGFFASILDSETGFPQIGTNAPDAVSLLALDISDVNTLADVSAYRSTVPAGVNASVSTFVPVPEPSSYALAGAASLIGVVLLRCRKLVRAGEA